MSPTNAVTHPGSTTATNPNIRVIRADERQVWPGGDVRSHQSFPATGSFKLEDNAFGLLLLHNDDTVSPGAGFDMHQHDNLEIVTWIADGALRHRDSQGGESIIRPGQAQAISAGSGVRHTEVNAAGFIQREHLRVIQMWIMPDTADTPPRHSTADFTEALSSGQWVTIATGAEVPASQFAASQSPATAPLPIGNSDATLLAARPTTDDELNVPNGAFIHLFVVSGQIRQADAGELNAGDVLRMTDAGEQTITATDDAEILAWIMKRGI